MEFRPPAQRIDSIARQLLKAMKENQHIEVKNEEGVIAATRAVLTENLRQEHELEKEVLATLQQHGQAIYEQNADFQKLLREGKKILAKKKGFTL